jgi:hypothetical protein
VTFLNCRFTQEKDIVMKLSGNSTKNITFEKSNISRQQIAVGEGVDANTIVVK